MRLLFLTTYFKPDITANGILITQLAEELAELGHQLTVVTSMPHYSTNRIWDDYRNRLWIREQYGKLDVIRLYLYVPSEKANILGRLLNYLSFNLSSMFALFFVPKPDILLIPSPPLTNGLVGIIMRFLRGVPYVYNVQDIYPDVAIRLNVLTSPRIIRLFQRMEQAVYRNAAAITVISEGFRQNLLSKAVPAKKIHVIPNFVDTEFIKPMPRRNRFSRDHGLDNRFVVLFAGNIGMSQALEHVLSAALTLSSRPEILILIVGNGTAKPVLEQKAKEWKLENVRFLPFQSHDDVSLMYASADLCLVTLRHGIAQDSVPSKVFSILGAAKPLIASVDRGSDTWRLISDANCGLCIEPEDPAKLASAILEVHGDGDRAAQMGQSGFAYIQENFTRQQVAKQYHDLFGKLIKES